MRLLPCRDRSAAPFKCLDAQYRRELVRVYLTNVEGICRRFVEEKREQLLQLKKSMGAFQIFWDSQTSQQRAEHATMKGDEVHKVGKETAWSLAQSLRLLLACPVNVHLVLAGIIPGRLLDQVLCCRASHDAILCASLLAVSMFALTSASFTLPAAFQVWWASGVTCLLPLWFTLSNPSGPILAVQGLVKHFFNEKEVTSTLVMDALYSGCKQVEENGRLHTALKVRTLLPRTLDCWVAVCTHRSPGVRPADAVLHRAGFAGNRAEAAVAVCTKGLLGWPACIWLFKSHAAGQCTACNACPVPACPWLQSGLRLHI